jgi:hypothetical protein
MVASPIWTPTGRVTESTSACAPPLVIGVMVATVTS